jgi:hypothetical protein
MERVQSLSKELRSGAGADPSGHLAIAMVQSFSSLYPLSALQLASFTINSKGAITTTNTWANMPMLPWNPDNFIGGRTCLE